MGDLQDQEGSRNKGNLKPKKDSPLSTNHGANRQPTNHAHWHVPCKVDGGSESVQMYVSFLFFDEACLRECLSQDRRGRARTLPTHLPGRDDATPTALALHPTRPRKVETLGGGEGCRGVVQDAGVQAPGVRITCCFRNAGQRLQLVRTWSFVGLRVDTALELTDGRAECLRVLAIPSADRMHPAASARAGPRAAQEDRGDWRRPVMQKRRRVCNFTGRTGRL